MEGSTYSNLFGNFSILVVASGKSFPESGEYSPGTVGTMDMFTVDYTFNSNVVFRPYDQS